MQTINYEELGLSRLATEFSESENLIAYLKIIMSEFQFLEDVYFDILEKRWLENAENAQLEVLGELVGQPKISLEGMTRPLTDEEYKILIRARISKNNTDCSQESIISLVGYVFNVDFVVLNDYKLRFEISFGKILTDIEKSILREIDLIPKPLGVLIGYISEFDPDNVLAFEGFPNAKGLGDINDPDVGGLMPSLV